MFKTFNYRKGTRRRRELKLERFVQGIIIDCFCVLNEGIVIIIIIIVFMGISS